MLRVENISKTFHPGTINEKKALQDLSLHLNSGDFVTVIGGNGAGKSTLMNSIAGVFPVDKGKIIIDGDDITKQQEHKRAKYIGRVFQDPMMGTAAGMMIEENLAIASRRGKMPSFAWSSKEEDKERFRILLQELDLGLENRMSDKVGLLSGGQRQALTLLMAKLNQPKLLLLDEPSLGLAPIIIQQIFSIIQKVNAAGTTVFLVEQNANQALRIANRGYVMENGRIVMSDSAANLLSSEEVRTAYLGM